MTSVLLYFISFSFSVTWWIYTYCLFFLFQLFLYYLSYFYLYFFLSCVLTYLIPSSPFDFFDYTAPCLWLLSLYLVWLNASIMSLLVHSLSIFLILIWCIRASCIHIFLICVYVLSRLSVVFLIIAINCSDLPFYTLPIPIISHNITSDYTFSCLITLSCLNRLYILVSLAMVRFFL